MTLHMFKFCSSCANTLLFDNGTTNTIGDTDDEDADGAGKSPKIPLSNRSSPAKKSQFREIDPEDLSHIRSMPFVSWFFLFVRNFLKMK